MRLFTVHIPPAAPRPGREGYWGRRVIRARANGPVAPVLVPEGFAWTALLFGPLFLLRHGLWWALAAWIGAALLVCLLPLPWAVAAGTGLWWLTALAGHDLRRLALAARGWPAATVVAEQNEDRALYRLLQQRPDIAAA